MDSIGTVNINVQKKSLKLWCKKKKITLHDISLTSKKEGSKMMHEEVSIGELVVAPTTTSNEHMRLNQ